MGEKIYNGIPASGGIAIGPAILYHPRGTAAPRRSLRAEEIKAEVERYKEAMGKTRVQIAELEGKMKDKLGEEHAAIFQAHQVVLDDPLFMEEIPQAIQTRRLNSEFLLTEALEKFKAVMASLDDSYFRERGGDIQDVGNRLIKNLT